MIDVPVQRFPALEILSSVQHGFVLRVPVLGVRTDRASALARISSHHGAVLKHLGDRVLRIAEQIHGNGVAVVDVRSPERTSGVDALVTDDPQVVLGIYVADCCAIYFVDPIKSVIALAHSGRKGTEQNIAAATVMLMNAAFASEPRNLVVQLSPCIRPPFYEVDFAAQILSQLRESGVLQVSDCGENTGSDLQRFYSYRMEKGRTGRMLAYMALDKTKPQIDAN
jgi:polyphenol oxidase